jgi:hypothetical protein
MINTATNSSTNVNEHNLISIEKMSYLYSASKRFFFPARLMNSIKSSDRVSPLISGASPHTATLFSSTVT